MISLERLENIAVERDTLPESYRTVLQHSSSVVVFSWRTTCVGRASLVTYSTAFQLSASPRLPRQRDPLSRRILCPKVHSYPACIQASEKRRFSSKIRYFFSTHKSNYSHKNNHWHPERGISTHALKIPSCSLFFITGKSCKLKTVETFENPYKKWTIYLCKEF